jgi:acyl-CoA dehydrogenase
MILAGLFVLLAASLALLYRGRGYWAFVLLAAGGLAAAAALGAPRGLVVGSGAGALALALLFGLPPIRTALATTWIMPIVGRLLPKMGDTEKVALEAGTVWWDGELFSGAPDWPKLLAFPKAGLSDRERAFLEGDVEELCRLLDDWAILQAGDLPKEAWDFIKTRRFFGMIIPREYGGLGFSALAHSAVITKLASRSVTAAVTVMVPNSLGPAELLLHYGTEEQKAHYLPRLAQGLEIPCFALTGPEAGSDAAATQSQGVVCRGTYLGKDVLGIRLDWRKRYITLGPVSTVIGLAFRLLDPDHHLGSRDDLGITCALVPSGLPGIEIGTRHDPMGIPFANGPNEGRGVFVPLDFIIGGRARAGEGWRMLMESLAAGRSISLPALSVGASELATRIIGAYATIREQFDTPIGRFEGIEEPLARIGGLTYLMNAARLLTARAVDAGERPAVLSAIVKCYLTEGMRSVLNDAMDVRAGAGICRGPRNLLAPAHLASPIGITVEGANILTRSMIIYGQGAIRCHPFAREEMAAFGAGDQRRFDAAFFGHVGFIFSTAARAFLLGLTGGRLARSGARGLLARKLQALSRMSAAFALTSDVAMATLGGRLKRKEKISGRLADALAWLYLGSAAAKRFEDDGRPAADLPFLRWSCDHALYKIEEALLGILANLPSRPAAFLLRPLLFPWGPRRRPPSDALGSEVARALLEDHEGRLRLTGDIFVPLPGEAGLGRLEAALGKAVDALHVEARLRDAVRSGRIDRAPGHTLAELGLAAGVVTPEDLERLRLGDAAREEAIQVDAFTDSEFRALRR